MQNLPQLTYLLNTCTVVFSKLGYQHLLAKVRTSSTSVQHTHNSTCVTRRAKYIDSIYSIYFLVLLLTLKVFFFFLNSTGIEQVESCKTSLHNICPVPDKVQTQSGLTVDTGCSQFVTIVYPGNCFLLHNAGSVNREHVWYFSEATQAHLLLFCF